MNTQSQEINELMTAMSKAQGRIGSAKKDKTNPFFKSSYADLSSVWDACRIALSENGIAVIQTTEPCDGVLMLVTTLGHSSGQWMKSHLPVIQQKNDHQSLGSAITYMRRYSLSAMVGVAPDDDDDGEAAMGKRNGNYQQVAAPWPQAAAKPKPQYIPKPKISKKQVQELEVLINGHDNLREIINDYVKTKIKGKSFADIPESHFDGVIKRCNEIIAKKFEEKTIKLEQEQIAQEK